MSMTARFLAITPADLEALILTPDRTVNLLFPGDDFASLGNRLDIDKSWHAIHYLLVGDKWEASHHSPRRCLVGRKMGRTWVTVQSGISDHTEQPK